MGESIRLDKPMQIHIYLMPKCRPKEVYNTAQKIQRLLNEEGYDYESVTINANILMGKILKTRRSAVLNTAPPLKKYGNQAEGC
ncbi:hypothetical protein PO124_16845 [Bacillus licheniformis]|nr:hypothetical protein [Bacillus licheniformis]